MAKKLIIYFVVLLLAICAGLLLTSTSGYVLVAYNHWTIQTTIWFAIVFIVTLILLSYFLMRTWSVVRHVPAMMQAKREKRRLQRRAITLNQGLLALIEERWPAAEKLLLKHVNDDSLSAINYLGAAVAANAQRATKRSHQYLSNASHCAADETLAVDLLFARLQLENKQFESALATLKRLQIDAPKQVAVLRLLKTLYLQTENWEALLALLPLLKRHKVIVHEEFQRLLTMVYINLMLQQSDWSALQAFWKTVPKAIREEAEVLVVYGELALEFNQDETVLTVVSDYLNKRWDENLIDLYGMARGDDLNKQFRTAEKWFSKYSQEPALLLALGKLAIKITDWTAAEKYLQLFLKTNSSSQACSLLGYVYERQGNMQKALNYYRQSVDGE